MLEFFKDLFSSEGFMPHGHCYLWNPSLIWLHVISDGLIALSYTSIPFTLYYFSRKRRDIPFNWMFLCFALFIVACGATHYMEIWTLWTPTYWLSGVIKAIAAAASVPTAILLVRLMPKALAIPTPQQLQQAYAELRQANDELETRVQKRTTELTKKNEALADEIVERKRVEVALRESEARKTAVMEAALDAIVLMDQDGKITDFNPAAERTFGYARDEVVGKTLGEMLVPASLRAEHTEGLTRYLKTGEEHVLGTRMEVPALRKSGEEFPAEIAVVRIRSGGPPIFTGYIRDISERRQAAEAAMLRTANEAAEEANGELEAFSYSVAHDLRAPLRGINGFSSALLDDYGDKLDAVAKEHLERIALEAKNMGEIIDALLALARLTRTELRREVVDLTKLSRDVIAQLRATEPTRHVDFVVADGLTEQGDPRLVRVLLENLLGNAWKFTGKRNDGRIELVRETVDGLSAFVIRDNGAGFDTALADKLFVPFRRLHRASEFEGTGIGLATVQRIARRHGGRIWAESIENRGATFRFTLSPAPRATS